MQSVRPPTMKAYQTKHKRRILALCVGKTRKETNDNQEQLAKPGKETNAKQEQFGKTRDGNTR